MAIEFYFAGTDSTALTQGNTGYSTVNPNGGAGFVYKSTKVNPLTGGTSGRITAAAGTAAEVRHAVTAATSAAQQFVLEVPPVPTASVCDMAQIRGTRQNAGIRLHTDGSLRVLRMGSEVGGAGVYNDWDELVGQAVVVDLLVVEGTTSSNGTIKARVRTLDDLSTTLWEYSATNVDAGVIGTDIIDSLRGWKITAAASFSGDWWVYGHRAVDGATAYLSDPVLDVDDPEPVADEWDALVADMRLSIPGNAGDLSYSLAHVSGPNLLADVEEPLDGLFLIPRDDTTSVYQVTVSESGGGSATYDITVHPGSGWSLPSGSVRRRVWDGAALV